MTRRGRRMPLAAATVPLGMALLVVGCASVHQSGFRDRVEQAAQQVAAGDVAGALATIDALDADVAVSATGGNLPPAEADRIAAAIAAMRTDLVALVAPPATPTAPPPASDPDTAAETSAAQTDDGNGGRSPGKGKAKGRPHD